MRDFRRLTGLSNRLKVANRPSPDYHDRATLAAIALYAGTPASELLAPEAMREDLIDSALARDDQAAGATVVIALGMLADSVDWEAVRLSLPGGAER